MPEIIQINSSNRYLVKFFLETAGNALQQFRYFESRSLEAIENHRATFVLRENKTIIGYGHLDEEEKKVWLGIAIADGYQGLGLGKLMMDNLFISAKMQDISEIQLSVDKDNRRAVKLYEKMGFQLFDESESVCFLKKTL